jgi:hypothetical protein
MTQDEIIETAVQAGMYREVLTLGRNVELLTAFAKLVAQHTLANIDPSKFMSYQEGMEAGRLAEREACAKVADEIATEDGFEGNYAYRCVEAIRARGQA